MNLENVKREIEAVIKGFPATLQVNRAVSQLTIVINRQQSELSEQFDYKVLTKKIMTVLHTFDLGEVRTIKFYGRKSGGQTEWQWATTVNSTAQDTATQKVVSKGKQPDAEDHLSASAASTNTSVNDTQTLGWWMFVIGTVMMGFGLIYDPSVPSGGWGDRSYNIGEITNKNTYTNTGGFIAVCGAIFATCSQDRKKKEKSTDEISSKIGN